MASRETGRTATVIGAGVVGMASALQLQRAGYSVTVVDRLPPGEAASFGNAGGIPVGHAFPLGLPGVLSKVPGYLMDPLGPLALRWSHLPRLAPWLLRFLRQSRPAAAEANFDAISTLMVKAQDAWAPLLAEAGIEDLVRPIGGITPYASEQALDRDDLLWSWLRKRGLKAERLNRDELRQLEPSLSPRYTCAMFEEDWKYALDPYEVVTGLAEHVQRRGGTILREVVSEVIAGPDGVTAIRTSRGLRPVGLLVVAAGAWSHRIAARLGSKVPLETCRGYHITIPEPGPTPRHMIFPPDFSCAITPMKMGLRLAGTAEFPGIDAPPDWRRAQKLARVAEAVFPGISTAGHTQWSGDRPILPDSVPVIGRSPHQRNVIYAFGHGFYGLTLGAVTGHIVAELAQGRQPAVDLTAYRVDRF